MSSATEVTTMFDGRVTVVQPLSGYRYAVDSLLLAHFALEQAGATGDFVELGAGSGVVSALLALAGRSPGLAIELQPLLLECCRATVEANALTATVECVQADMRKLRPIIEGNRFPLVVSNPPYHPAGSGRISPDSVTANARHELTCTMNDIVSAARYLLASGGQLALVYPATRLPQLLSTLTRHKFATATLGFVHPSRGKDACNVLALATKTATPACNVLPPRYIHKQPGEYDAWFDELQQLCLC